MNLKELKEKIDNTYKFCRSPDEIIVYITTNEPSMGSRAKCGIRNAYKGIDWERNEFRIEPETKLKKDGKDE